MRLVAMALLAGVIAAAPAAAQDQAPDPVTKPAPKGSAWTDIGFLSVDGGYQGANAGSFTDRFSLPAYSQLATVAAQYSKKDAPTFNIAWTFRLFDHLGAGIAVGAANRTTTSALSGSIPNPLDPRTLRAATGATSLDRNETGVHIQVSYVISFGRNALVSLYGGPSYFTVKQQLVDSVQVRDDFPYTAPLLLPLEPSEVKESAVGFNAGADVGYYFTSAIGIGGMARYARSTIRLPFHGSTLSTEAGGFQVGIGVRVRLPKSNKTKTPGRPPTKPVRPGPVKAGPGK